VLCVDVSLGFAGGIMTAASFWSLLAPAIEISEHKIGAYAFLPVGIGFVLGGAFVAGADCLIPRFVYGEA
jgi:zinc transporter ZupT